MDSRTLLKVIKRLRSQGMDVRVEARRGIEHRLLYEHEGYYTLITRTRRMLLPLWLKKQLDPRSPGYQEGLDVPVVMNRVYREWALIGARSYKAEVIASPDAVFMRSPWGPGIWFYALRSSKIIHPSGSGKLVYRYDDLIAPVYVVEYSEDKTKLKITSWPSHELGGVIVDFKASNIDLAVIAIRPLNPLGVSVVNKVEATSTSITAYYEGSEKITIHVSRVADNVGAYSIEENGDITEYVEPNGMNESSSETGWASGGLYFYPENGRTVSLRVFIPLERDIAPISEWYKEDVSSAKDHWLKILGRGYEFKVSDNNIYTRYWRNIAVLQILFDSGRITPGPTIYHRFWIRDAAYMAKALLEAGYHLEARSIVNKMIECIRDDGYVGAIDCKPEPFEADSPGQLLWIMKEYLALTKDSTLVSKVYKRLLRVAEYIVKMFDEGASTGWLHPPSTSAEDLGPRNHYYWDVYWSIAGLWSIAGIAEQLGDKKTSEEYIGLASEYEELLFRDLSEKTNRSKTFHPTSPNRLFLDSGIGRSLVAIWPLRILPEDTTLARELVDNAWKFVYNGGFIHDIIWRAYGSYITMHLAEASILVGYRDKASILHKWLVKASQPLNHWCEAHSVKTLKGTVGDYPHGWASADYILLARLMVLHEDYNGSKLSLFKGLGIEALRNLEVEARTSKGKVKVKARIEDNRLVTEASTPKYSELLVYPPIGYKVKSVEPRDQVIDFSEDVVVVSSGRFKLNLVLEKE